jgi:hypothetical protein
MISDRWPCGQLSLIEHAPGHVRPDALSPWQPGVWDVPRYSSFRAMMFAYFRALSRTVRAWVSKSTPISPKRAT